MILPPWDPDSPAAWSTRTAGDDRAVICTDWISWRHPLAFEMEALAAGRERMRERERHLLNGVATEWAGGGGRDSILYLSRISPSGSR
jgi:hypothetical protein